MFLALDTAYPIKWQDYFAHDVGAFREWLGRREKLETEDGKPIWWRLMALGGWECMEELLASNPNEHEFMLNWKDSDLHGWVWMGLAFNIPEQLLSKGLDMIGLSWDDADIHGVDPLKLAVDAKSIHILAKRLWRDSPLTCGKRMDTLAACSLNQASKRAWNFWQAGVH